jgi:hypothetical protein
MHSSTSFLFGVKPRSNFGADRSLPLGNQTFLRPVRAERADQHREHKSRLQHRRQFPLGKSNVTWLGNGRVFQPKEQKLEQPA